jgi:hypothetical protein
MAKRLARLEDKDFYALMGDASDFEMIIKSAIVIESEIEEIFGKAFLEPDRLLKMRLTYDQKVELLLALGLQVRFGPPLRALANLRNKFAHNIDAEFSKDDADNFFASFDKYDRTIVLDNYNKTKLAPGPFKDLHQSNLFLLCVISLRAAIIIAGRQTEQLLQPPKNPFFSG